MKDGDEVTNGQPLFDVEAKGLSSRRKTLETTYALFELQARTLKSILSSDGDPSRFEGLPDSPVVDDISLNSQLITARQQSQQFRSRLEQIAARLGSRRATMVPRANCQDMKPLLKMGRCLVTNICCS